MILVQDVDDVLPSGDLVADLAGAVPSGDAVAIDRVTGYRRWNWEPCPESVALDPWAETVDPLHYDMDGETVGHVPIGEDRSGPM